MGKKLFKLLEAISSHLKGNLVICTKENPFFDTDKNVLYVGGKDNCTFMLQLEKLLGNIKF